LLLPHRPPLLSHRCCCRCHAQLLPLLLLPSLDVLAHPAEAIAIAHPFCLQAAVCSTECRADTGVRRRLPTN
jgi:hypothetical protein